jgi:hypothetical protein
MWCPVDTEVSKTLVGGLTVLDNAFGAKAILGFGAKRGGAACVNELAARFEIPGYVFDHSLDEDVPEVGPNVEFVPEGITDKTRGPLFTLAQHVATRGLAGQQIILKLNAAGAEWDVLKTCSLENVTQLIVELHDMHMAVPETLKRIADEFHLVHIKAKGPDTFWLTRSKRMPRHLECTWVRRDLIKEATPTTVPCEDLRFWLPAEHTVSFVTENPVHHDALRRIMNEEDEICADATKATKDYIMVFEPDDLIPGDIIVELDKLFKNEAKIDKIVVPVVYNGLVSQQARIYKRETTTDVTVLIDRSMFNFAARSVA